MWSFFFFLRAMREALGGGTVRKDKGGTRPGIHRPPHLLLKPRSARPAGWLWCWSPRTRHGGCARKTCKIIWDKTRWLVLTNELMNIKWKTVTEKLLKSCEHCACGKERPWMKQHHNSFDSGASVPGGSCMPFAWASKAGRQFLMVSLHPRRMKRQRTANSLFTWYVWICTNRVVMPKAPFLMS